MDWENYKERFQEYDDEDEWCVTYSDEGDEIPYTLEHITTETLYKEFIEDVSDDKLMQLKNKGGGYKGNE